MAMIMIFIYTYSKREAIAESLEFFCLKIVHFIGVCLQGV